MRLRTRHKKLKFQNLNLVILKKLKQKESIILNQIHSQHYLYIFEFLMSQIFYLRIVFQIK